MANVLFTSDRHFANYHSLGNSLSKNTINYSCVYYFLFHARKTSKRKTETKRIMKKEEFCGVCFVGSSEKKDDDDTPYTNIYLQLAFILLLA
jgi:hypothetical protein